MTSLINSLWSALLRILLLLFGLAMFFGVMVLGVVAAIGISVWALIRGRRVVPFDFGWRGPVDWRAGARRASRQPSSSPDQQVVDIEARVIDKPAAPPQDKTPPAG